MGFSLKNVFKGVGKGVTWTTHQARNVMQMPGQVMQQNIRGTLSAFGISGTTLLLIGGVVIAVVLINR
jgi:hypothetical protein